MAQRQKTRPETTGKQCPTCKGEGELTVPVRVGGRRKRVTNHQQTLICSDCWGSGTTPN